MEAIVAQEPDIIKTVWVKAIEYLGKYAQRASPKRDRKTGRAQFV